jgi:hypothetical protein
LAFVPPVPVIVTVRAAGDAPTSCTYTSLDRERRRPFCRFSVQVPVSESDRVPVTVPGPVELPIDADRHEERRWPSG